MWIRFILKNLTFAQLNSAFSTYTVSIKFTNDKFLANRMCFDCCRYFLSCFTQTDTFLDTAADDPTGSRTEVDPKTAPMGVLGRLWISGKFVVVMLTLLGTMLSSVVSLMQIVHQQSHTDRTIAALVLSASSCLGLAGLLVAFAVGREPFHRRIWPCQGALFALCLVAGSVGVALRSSSNADLTNLEV